MKHALAFFFDWELTLTVWPDKASAEAACVAAFNECTDSDCKSLEEWQALEYEGRCWDYRITPCDDPGSAPSPSGADLEAPEGEEGEGPTDETYREAARDRYGCDGEIEIDPGAPVSRGDDPGAYVQAWVWVDDSDLEA